MVNKRKKPKTGREEYCLVSVSSGKVLEWYGPKKPSDEKVLPDCGRALHPSRR